MSIFIIRLSSLLLATTWCISIATCALGEEPMLFPISVEGGWGYIDGEGKVVIEPQFLKARKFSEGLAVVAVAGTSDEDRFFERKFEGFIGPDGKFVIPAKPPTEALKVKNYDTYSYGDFHEGLARIHVNDASGMDGFIDRTGKLVVPLKFDTTAEFSEGLAFASTWRAWDDPGPRKNGFIDKQGRFVIENKAFRFAYAFSEDRAVVSVDADGSSAAYCLIDKQGSFVIRPGKYSSLTSATRGAVIAYKNSKAGLLDINGEVIVPLKYDYILEPVEGDVFTAVSAGKVELISARGKLLAKVASSGDVGRFSEGLATIEEAGRHGYIDAKGAIAIAPQFDQAESFEHGLALVKEGTTKGYINLQGKFVWKTNRWDEPIRNSVSKPLSTFLPDNKVEALPLSYNWERVKNAIVFVTDGNLDDMRAWYKKRCTGKLELKDHSNFDTEPNKLDMEILRPDAGYLEVFAMAGTGDKDAVDGFVNFYACSNMTKLRKQHPKKIIGILIEN